MFERNKILQDLRENVMAVYINSPNNQRVELFLTMMTDLLPPTYMTEGRELEKKFHEDNPNLICAFDVRSRNWCFPISIESVIMVQSVDHTQFM